MKPSNRRSNLLTIMVLCTCFVLTATFTAPAQTASPMMMQMATSELQKRGLSETEVRARLLQEGIDVDNIAPTEYANYQTKVIAVLDKMVSEKKTVTAAKPKQTATDVLVAPKTTAQEAQADAAVQAEKKEKAAAVSKSDIYGHDLFADKTLEAYRTTDGAQAPDTYVLGAGDEVHITIFGASQTDIQQRITNEGYISPAGVARIFLKGLTLAQARNVIRQSLSNSYLFRADQLAVTITTARTVLVNVFGEVNLTGGFTLSALNSALNVLSAAGGPTQLGSVRNIQLIRGTSKKNIDLYQFMGDPSVAQTFDLQNNDVLFVPVAKSLVKIEGAVKRPMRYEIVDGEHLNDLIQLAGGLTKDVYPEFVQVKRYLNGEEKLLEWKLSDITSGKTKVALTDGDVVSIKSINKPIDTYVQIDGSVYYPGRYDLSKNPTLTEVLANAKPNNQARMEVVFVERTRADETIEFLRVPGASNFALQGRDKIRIMSLTDYRDVDSISVVGQVRKPFAKAFNYTDRITINQAIEYAGGLKESSYPVAYIFRKNLFQPGKVSYLRIDLKTQGNTNLQAGDKLTIYDNRTYLNVGELRISGAVKNARNLTFDPSLSLKDLIVNAGGFNLGAAFNRVEVFRTVLSPTEKPKLELITLSVDSTFKLITPATFALQPFDQVVVRMTPEFTLGRTVELNGQVRYPGVYVLESRDATLADVIKKAGGLLRDADPWGAKLFRTYKNRGDITINVRKAVYTPNSRVHNPILFEGDVININRLENTVSILQHGTRMAQYSTDSIDDQVKNIVYQGNHGAGWYIRNFAGGFQKNADRFSVTATYPNNQMVATKRVLGMRYYPRVVPGSIITLKMDEEKVKEDLEPKEKLDFETTVSKTLSVLTSTLSIILLVKSLK